MAVKVVETCRACVSVFSRACLRTALTFHCLAAHTKCSALRRRRGVSLCGASSLCLSHSRLRLRSVGRTLAQEQGSISTRSTCERWAPPFSQLYSRSSSPRRPASMPLWQSSRLQCLPATYLTTRTTHWMWRKIEMLILLQGGDQARGAPEDDVLRRKPRLRLPRGASRSRRLPARRRRRTLWLQLHRLRDLLASLAREPSAVVDDVLRILRCDVACATLKRAST
mmetsp:Transcript_37543/g.62156  ORF Transcript_37543/g.62156 Transcript_37543/m.62156 type:complete len:225 (-) Transcript_37543:266-940(-)